MGQEILVNEQKDAGSVFVREFNEFRRVTVACWIKPSESHNLFLYVASDQIDDSNLDMAYGEVLQILGGKKRQWLDSFQVKLINSADPIARDAIAICDRYHAPLAMHYNGSSLGGTSIDDAYIYPPLSATKSTT